MVRLLYRIACRSGAERNRGFGAVRLAAVSEHLGDGRIHSGGDGVGIFRRRQQRSAEPGEQGLHLQRVQHGRFNQQRRWPRRRQRPILFDQPLDRLAIKLLAVRLGGIGLCLPLARRDHIDRRRCWSGLRSHAARSGCIRQPFGECLADTTLTVASMSIGKAKLVAFVLCLLIWTIARSSATTAIYCPDRTGQVSGFSTLYTYPTPT